jgi:hypothetical protein
MAPNPDFGATFTYHLASSLEKPGADRKRSEKELAKAGKDVPFPGYDALEAEMNEEKSRIWLLVKDANGKQIRRLNGPGSKGIHRVTWDLRYPDNNVVRLGEKFDDGDRGWMAGPGTYTVTLAKEEGGKITVMTEPVEFEVVNLRKGVLKGSAPNETVAFWRWLEDIQQRGSATAMTLGQAIEKLDAMRSALYKSEADAGDLDAQMAGVRSKLLILRSKVDGNAAKNEVGEKKPPSIFDRVSFAQTGTRNSTYGPTPSHTASLNQAEKALDEVQVGLTKVLTVDFPALEKALKAVDAPWIEGQPLRIKN